MPVNLLKLTIQRDDQRGSKRNARMEEASCNNLANKNQVHDALDLGDKNRFKHK